MELTKITIDDTEYKVQEVHVNEMVSGQRYVFFGIKWYKVLDFNLHNHIKKDGTKNNCKV